MKIIYGITKSNFGGAQRYVFDLATEAKKAGHEVKVAHGQIGLLTDKLRAAEIETIQIPGMARDINLLAEIPAGIEVMKILNREKPEVFHINSSKMGGTGSFAVRLMNLYWRLTGEKHRTKAIFTSHGWAFNETWRPWWQKLLIKKFVWLTILFSHKTICVSEKTKENVQFPFIKRRLAVIHNGIAEFELLERSVARKAFGIHDDTLIVGTLSELHPVKGLDTLLDAWKRFTNKHEAILLMLGDGEIRKSLEDYASDLGVSEKVIFKGYVENARSYLAALDIVCMPSRSENLPYAILEAGLAERPVIATRVGGIPEIIENGLSGTLVPPEDSETLFSALLLFAQDEALRNRLGLALKETVKEKFSLEKMVTKTLALY